MKLLLKLLNSPKFHERIVVFYKTKIILSTHQSNTHTQVDKIEKTCLPKKRSNQIYWCFTGSFTCSVSQKP